MHITYNYSEGGKSPTIIEPCVTVIATGEVLFDFWRIRLNGHLDEFDAAGFRLTVSDKYQVATVGVRVDARSHTFTLADDSTGPRPLCALRDTLFWRLDRLRNEREDESSLRMNPPSTLLARLKAWFRESLLAWLP